ncbi:MAG: cell division protein FtsA [Blastocatellia bacterium]
MPKQNAPIVGLDIGTSNVRVVIAELLDGQLDVAGVGEAPSKGLRKGMISKPDLTVDAIRRAIESAELMSGLTVSHVYVGLAGANIEGQNSKGMITVPGRHREINREDIGRVIEMACNVSIPSGREIADYLPQEYTVDGQEGIDDPLGMLGTRLEVSVHIITSPVAAKQNVITSVNRSGYTAAGVYLSHIAAAEAVLTDDDKEYGVAVVNIGGETTSLAIYQRGSVWHTAVIPLGGNHFTSDIAIGLRTPIPEAERIKRDYGCAFLAMLTPEEAASPIVVPSVGGRDPRKTSRQVLHGIIEPRAEEIMTKVHEEIVSKGFEKRLSSGIVLTGGGALLDGMIEVAEDVLKGPARLGVPGDFSGLEDEVGSPGYSAAVGLALHGMRSELGLMRGSRNLLRRPSVSPIKEKVKSFFGIKR